MQTKKEIFDEVIKEAERSLRSVIEQANMASDAAIDAPGRNESRYDSTKEEMGHLSNILSKKILYMKNTIKNLSNFHLPGKSSVVLPGSLVKISMDNNIRTVFLLPCGGGQKISVGNVDVLTISKQAPLYSALLKRKVGEKVLFNEKQVFIKKIE